MMQEYLYNREDEIHHISNTNDEYIMKNYNHYDIAYCNQSRLKDIIKYMKQSLDRFKIPQVRVIFIYQLEIKYLNNSNQEVITDLFLHVNPERRFNHEDQRRYNNREYVDYNYSLSAIKKFDHRKLTESAEKELELQTQNFVDSNHYGNILNTKVITLRMNVMNVISRNGGCYIDFPFKNLCILNIQTERNDCGILCIDAYNKNIKDHAYRSSNYSTNGFNLENITFPMTIEDFDIFEQNNSEYAVNIYFLNDKLELSLERQSQNDHSTKNVYLVLYHNHYCLVR